MQSRSNQNIYIQLVYTKSIHNKMVDIYENTILCNKCNKKTKRSFIVKDGFKIRTWQCPVCKKQWPHPLDLQAYQNFSKIKNKSFQVKLRMVGNSYTVSIPREIIEFENDTQKEFNKMRKRMDQIIHMSLEEPEKLSLFFTNKIRKIYNEEAEED